jgi:hypothetical protein
MPETQVVHDALAHYLSRGIVFIIRIESQFQ